MVTDLDPTLLVGLADLKAVCDITINVHLLGMPDMRVCIVTCAAVLANNSNSDQSTIAADAICLQPPGSSVAEHKHDAACKQ